MVIVNRDGRILLVNAQTETLFGYPREELVGQWVELLIPERFRRKHPEHRTGYFGDPRVRSMGSGLELYGLRKDGTEFPIEISLSPLQTEEGLLVSSAIRDITERKKAEDKFRGLMESAPDAMVIVDGSGQIVLINAQTETLFGYRRDELLGQSIESLVPARFRGRHPAHRGEYFTTRRPRPMGGGVDLFGLRKDGSEFAAEISLSPIDTVEGTLVTAAIRDITDRKQLEERMQQANRLKSEFLANMSHELRTPLNAIIGFAELMQDGEVDPTSAQHAEFLGYILSSGRHLLQLVNDILDLSKVEAGKMDFHPETVHLHTLVGEVSALLGTTAAAKKIHIDAYVDPRLENVVLDPARFKQVLYNYLSNALKFSADGGRVSLRVQPEGEDCFRLEVEDTGVGIKPADLARLFVEFQQLDAALTKKHAGTGLGLALTKRLVEAQGGSVGVDSRFGEGSIFHAILPCVVANSTPVARRSTLPAAADGSPCVLVIEDNLEERELIAEALLSAGYHVEQAATGVEGLELFQRRQFDAVTLDLVLPDMHGLELLRQLRCGSKQADVPVLIVSVLAGGGAVTGFPVHDVLSKPLDAGLLVASLRRAGVATDAQGRVLVVDDDAASLALMALTLEQVGYRPLCRRGSLAALQAVEATVPLAVILDLSMPEMSGFEFLERFRTEARNRDVPVIIWTAKDLTSSERSRLRSQANAVFFKASGATDGLLRELKGTLTSAPFRDARLEP
jgi:protein-histidine pros-kinase